MSQKWFLVRLLIVGAFLPFALPLVSSGQLGPTEHFTQSLGLPGATRPSTGWDALQADGVLQFWPWRDVVFDSWRRGEIPLVNPYQLAGQPILANSQSGALYPFHILFAFFPGRTATKMLILGALHALIAGFGVRALARRLGASEIGSTAAGLGLMGSQFMIAWAPLASVGTTFCWLPWVLVGILMGACKKGIGLVAASCGMMLLGGHLQFAAYGLIASLVVILIQGLRQRSLLPLVSLVGILVGGIIAAPQAASVLQFSQLSHRKNAPTPEGYSAYAGGAMQADQALSLLNPYLTGSSRVKDEAGPGYLPMLTRPGANAAEAALFVSPILLVLAFFAARKTPRAAAEWAVPLAIGIVGWLLSVDNPILRLMYFHFPGWSATGSPSRAHCLVVLALCVLGGIGLTRLEGLQLSKPARIALVASPLAVFATGRLLAPILLGAPPGADPEAVSSLIARVNTQLLVPSLLVPISGILGFLLLTAQPSPGKRVPPAWLGIAVLLAPLEMLRWGPALNLTAGTPNPNGPRVAGLARRWSLLETPEAGLPGNLASIVRKHDLFGYDSLLNVNVVAELNKRQGGRAFPPENGNLLQLRDRAAAGGYRDWGLGAIIEPGTLTERPLGPSRDPAESARFSPPGSGTIIREGYASQTIKLFYPGKRTVMRQPLLPGTRVLGGNCTLSSVGGLTEIACKEGGEEVRILFPGPSPLNLGLSAFLLLGSLGLALFSHEKPSEIAGGGADPTGGKAQ